jgi:hypothetical protein
MNQSRITVESAVAGGTQTIGMGALASNSHENRGIRWDLESMVSLACTRTGKNYPDANYEGHSWNAAAPIGWVLCCGSKSQPSIERAVQRLRPQRMAVFAVLASLVPILRESSIGSGRSVYDEADCCSDRRRHDLLTIHVLISRTDVLGAHEGAGAPAWNLGFYH